MKGGRLVTLNKFGQKRPKTYIRNYVGRMEKGCVRRRKREKQGVTFITKKKERFACMSAKTSVAISTIE